MAAEQLSPIWNDVLNSLPPTLSPKDASARIGLSQRTIARRLKDGSLAHAKVGARVVIPRQALVEMLARGA